MALLNRLFSSRKKQQSSKGYVPAVSQEESCKTFDFSKDQVRVLLFRECERRGRKLLFDSKAVRKQPLANLAQQSKSRVRGKSEETVKQELPFVEISNGFGYQYTRPSSDIKSLGEMIFGSVAMTLRGSTFKVHTGGSPPVLMFTKVSNSPYKKTSDRGLEDSYGSSINSINDFFFAGSCGSDSKLSSSSGSCPLDVPLSSSLASGVSQFYIKNEIVTASGHHQGSLEADSGCYTNSDSSAAGLPASGSFNPALASPDSQKGSGGSLSSLRRRWLRTASTSLDLDSSLSLNHADSLASYSSLPTCAEDKPLRRTKLGVALIISLTHTQEGSMQEFLLEHAALLESMLVRLHAAVERAYCRKELFVSMMFDASCDVEQGVEDLLIGPRLAAPVWLGLLSNGLASQAERATIATGFIQELCLMLENFDTKDTNFFMSTVITAVLTHHLGWVPTVTPALQLCLRQSSFDDFTSPSTLSDLPKLHPYNALWAQTMDLYGALGHPLKTSRTIIMSSSSNKSCIETIERLLRILSFFIRCAGIERQEPRLEDYDIQTSLKFNSGPSKKEAMKTITLNDRTYSSSTLRPTSGKCSPLLGGIQASVSLSSSDTVDSLSQNQKPFVNVDNISSKSENSLNLALKELTIERPKQPSSRGLRRTMSYNSRMSSSAVVEYVNKEKQICQGEACSDDKFHIICGYLQEGESNVPGGQKTPTAPKDSEKVIFVLGENEDLVGLREKKNKHNQDLEENKELFEGRGKLPEQPLSFSGSEVESGFSECESFELSPARTASEKVLTCNSKSWDLMLNNSQGLKKRHFSAKVHQSKENFISCPQKAFNKDESHSFLDVNHLAMVDKASYSHPKYEKSDSSAMSALKLQSLARSLSVNLPICLKSSKQENCWVDPYVFCECKVTKSEIKENIHPVKELPQTILKKSMKRLRRAHSSFCVHDQSRKSSKSITASQNCEDCKDDPKLVEEGICTNRKNSVDTRSPCQAQCPKLKSQGIVELPLPLSCPRVECAETICETGMARTLFGGVSTHYIPERVLQGCSSLGPGWEVVLKRDLALDAQRPTLDPGLSEAVAIVANIDSWEVQVISSHTYVVDRPGTLGVRAGLSQLVANMLESVYHMWKLHAPSELCLSYLESRLQEMLLRSRALADLLLTTELCDMDSLTSSLSLEPNDVPLLLSVASTHSPEVTQRYGLSFR